MSETIILKLVNDAHYFDKIPEDEEYKKLSDEFDGLCETLCKGMSDKEKFDILWKLDSAQCDMEYIMCEQYFREGFRLGLKIAIQNLVE